MTPLLQGLSLRGVYSPRPGVAWIVGDGGTLLRAEGTQVTASPSPTHEALTDVWGSSDADVWAVGGAGTLLHWDGVRWSAVSSPAAGAALNAVSGATATSVWAGGAAGLLMHWDGTTWATVTSSTTDTVLDIWAAGPADAWVVAGNNVLRCSPSGCRAVVHPGLSFEPRRVSGAAPEDVYFLSGTSEAFRWNAGAWTRLDISLDGNAFDLKVTGPEELWFAVATVRVIFPPPPVYQVSVKHFSQGQLAETLLAGSLSNVDGERLSSSLYLPYAALAVSSRDDIWAVGRSGRIHRREGTTEVSLERGTPVRQPFDYAVSRTVLQGALFESIAELPGSEDGSTPASLVAAGGGERLWVAGPREVWSATTVPRASTLGRPYDPLQVYRSQEGRASLVFEQSRNNEPRAAPIGLHGSSASDVWVVDWSGLYRFDGTEVSQVLARSSEPGGYPFTGPVWSFAPDDVWFGGANGLHHWNGSEMEDTSVPGFAVTSLWASWKGDLWAVGSQDGRPRADRWDGSAWTEVPLPAGTGVSRLVHVTGRCPGEVYLIGNHSAVFRWDGEQLHTVPVPIRINLLSATRLGSELWVAGGAPDADLPYVRNNRPVIIRTSWLRP